MLMFKTPAYIIFLALNLIVYSTILTHNCCLISMLMQSEGVLFILMQSYFNNDRAKKPRSVRLENVGKKKNQHGKIPSFERAKRKAYRGFKRKGKTKRPLNALTNSPSFSLSTCYHMITWSILKQPRRLKQAKITRTTRVLWEQ